MSPKPVILVVDDDAPILLLMRNLLREYGFDPMTASNGPQAVEQAATKQPDLILLDLNMPGMSGDATIAELHKIDGLAKTPILILSGEPLDDDEVARLGAAGSVLKPFDVPALISMIRAHLAD